MRGRALVVVALLVTAGCAGPLSGGGEEGPETVAPQLAGTPTPTATPDAAASVPGVSDESVDADRLAAVHRGTLRERPRTVRRVFTVRADNGTLVGRNTAVVRGSGDGTVRLRGTSAGTAPQSVGLSAAWIDFWTNGTVAAAKRAVEGNVSYIFRGPPLPPGRQADTTGFGLVQFAFRTASVTSVEPIDDDAVRVTGETAPDATVRNVSLTARIGRDGVVTRLRLAYTDDDGFRIVRRLEVTRVNETVVKRPVWLATARNASNDQQIGLQPGGGLSSPAADARVTVGGPGDAPPELLGGSAPDRSRLARLLADRSRGVGRSARACLGHADARTLIVDCCWTTGVSGVIADNRDQWSDTGQPGSVE